MSGLYYLYKIVFTKNNFTFKSNRMLLFKISPTKKFFISLICVGLVIVANGQDKKPQFTNISVKGYARSYFIYRNLKENYEFGGAPAPKTFSINGVFPDSPLTPGQVSGYREPLLMLLLSGKPSPNTSFDIDFIIDNQMTGQIFNKSTNANNANIPTTPRRIQSYRWLNLGGGIITEFGNFDLKAGGVLYHSQSPFTLWNFEYRDDMFERYPWEWQTVSFKRYTDFYSDKNIGRDSRWGSGSIQGFTLVGTGLPLRSGFRLAYGKSNSTGGFQTYLNNNNQDLISGQINKRFSSHMAALNVYQSRVILNPDKFDRSYKNIQREDIFTGELKLSFEKLKINSEFGTGSLVNRVDSIRNWDPLISVKANISKDLVFLPMSVQYYYIGANIVNLNSAVLNSSNRNIQPDPNLESEYNVTTFEGAVTEFGQMANNRQGINISALADVKKLKMVLSLSSQQEIENRFNLITFQHRLNGINRSRFVFYRNNIGPYGRQLNAWRRSWEKIAVTDTETDYLKGYNLIDLSVKYQFSVLGRPIIASNYINYNSVQDHISPIALFNDKAFIRSFYEEFMLFVSLNQKLTLVGLAGAEKVKGNERTELAPNGKPIDQTGYGLGLGLDIDFSSTTGLYFRHRWYSFSDENFVLDRFKGYDTNIELKVFF